MPKVLKPTYYGISKTIPGQSLQPAELLKRHLAGTLPDIDLNSRYEYHFNENDERIGSPLPTEMHELHKIALELKKARQEEIIAKRKDAAERWKGEIIAEYQRQQLEKEKLEPKPDKPDDKQPVL